MAEDNEINPFSYVEINGLKIAEPAAAYNLLWDGTRCRKRWPSSCWSEGKSQSPYPSLC